jgi:hypothetical protein
VDCVGQRHGGARGIATGLHHHHKGGGGGNDLAVDAVALLVRLVEQPVGAHRGGELGAGDPARRLPRRVGVMVGQGALRVTTCICFFCFFGKSGAMVVWL